MTAIHDTVRSYILREYLSGGDPEELTDDTELIESRIVNSIARLRLRAFLEDEFDIELGGHELDSSSVRLVPKRATSHFPEGGE